VSETIRSTIRSTIRDTFAAEGLEPSTWSNTPGYRYGEHDHPHHKVLFCVSGSITFHTPDGDIEMVAGDRIDLPPGTRHSATVGDDGVTCMEAAR
jgi:quercetin dioxygenase-like cupin family protein